MGPTGVLASGPAGLIALLVVGGSAYAADQAKPIRELGIRLVDDLTLKWKDVIPEVTRFEPADGGRWQPWGLAEAEASIPARTGRLRLGLGVGRLGLHLDSHTIVEGSAARVRLRLGFDVGGGRLTLRLPDVKMTPRFEKGQIGMDWVVPILEERF